MAQVTIATGFDVDYYLDQVGVDYYLTAGGEPPGIWAGKGAEALGLSGQVGGGGDAGKASADVMRGLFHYDVLPDGTPLGTAQRRGKYPTRAAYAQVEAAIRKRIEALGRFVTPEEKREIRLQERAKMRSSTPYYDLTFSAEKSVSMMHAGYRAAAKRARDEQREQDAEQFEARARAVESAVMGGATRMLELAEQRGAIVRTGHHSASSGEFRDAAGFVAVKFLQHDSRAGDPQLHVQTTVLNRAQRADGADTKWRALDARPLFKERLGFSAHAGLREAQELAAMGLPLVKRADGNGFEVGGVDARTLAAFSKRTEQINAELQDLLIEYRQMYGREPDRRALYKLRKRVTLSTRAAKAKTEHPESETPEDRSRAAEDELGRQIRKARDASVQELDSLHEATEAYAAEHPEARPEQLPSEEKRTRMIRAAVAEVQRQNSMWTRAQLEWELYRQLVVLPAEADWEQYLDDMADDVLSGRAPETDVIRIAPVPDVVDVSTLDHRKDGTSVYRPTGEAKFVTTGHMDTEEWILGQASKAAAAKLVTEEQAAAALEGTDLDRLQRRVVMGMLTSERFVTCLVAPAGTGKTHVTAAFSRAWTQITGGRVIGLTLSENAARVMAGEGVAEAWNITRFFANKVHVGPRDVLVLDEASQISTNDLARIMSLALQTGARIAPVGDTEQLGAVEAGGMFPLIAKTIGHWNLSEVRRFTQAWEAEASLRIRAGDVMALAAFHAHGRIYEGPQDRMHDDAVDLYMSNAARGKATLLLAGTNEEAAQLGRLVRERRIELGQITGRREVTLKDGNAAGVGDLVRARLNTRIDAGGQRLTNRDTLRLTGFVGTGKGRFAVAERQTSPGEWSAPFDLPMAYLEESAELAYAGNVYVAQGATVDIALLVVSEGMSRDLLYVGMTRGREKNLVFVVTGPADPAGMPRADREAYARDAIARATEMLERGDRAGAMAVSVIPPDPEGMRERAPWEAVLAAAMHLDDPGATAIGQMRAAQEYVTNTRHLLTLSEAFWQQEVAPQVDEALRQRIGVREYERYLSDPERPAFLQALRAHEIGGRSVEESLDAITVQDMAGARSIAAVLHGRLGKEPAPAAGQTATWAERAPRHAPERIADTQQLLDSRQAELGRLAAERPEPWALQAWGVPPTAEESAARRADWERNAGIVASYREAAGITDPAQAIGPVPSSQAQLREAFRSSVRALQLADDQALLRAMGRGELEALVDERERAMSAAPADVSAELAAVERQHAAQAAAAEAAREIGNDPAAQSAEILAGMHAVEMATLRVRDAARREWAEATAGQDTAARAAERELQRRGMAERIPGTDAEVVEVSAQEREMPAMEPAEWARLKAEQTAQYEADRQARIEASARAFPVTEAEVEKYGGARPTEGVRPDPGEVARQRQEQALQLAQARERERTFGPETEPEPAHVNPDDWAAQKADQSERVAAEREARREAAARLTPVTDTELAQYSVRRPAARPTAEPGSAQHEQTPSAERSPLRRAQLNADLTEIRERTEAIEDAVRRIPGREAERAAEIDAAGENEPVIHEPQVEAELELSWRQGETSADYDTQFSGREPAAAIEDVEAELDI